MSKLQQSSVLITGCSEGGAGHALALEFASKGMRVFATARSIEALKGLAEKGVELFTLDVTSEASIVALKAQIETRTGGRLDMLFNNAGSMYEVPAIEADPRRVRAMFDANVFGVFDMVSAFTPLLLASVQELSHPPIIVNTASVLARVPYPFSSAYNASKAAVAAYSDTLRLELAPLGIKVVTLFMGVVSTGISSPSTIQFDYNSLFADAETGVKQRSKEHQVSGMKADQFAKQVVESLLNYRGHLNKGEYIWKGSNAFLVWLLNAVGWRKIFDASSEKEVGMNETIKQSIKAKGKAAVLSSK